MVVTQLAERMLPTLEVNGSNPVIGILLYRIFAYCQLCIEKKMRPGMAQLQNIENIFQSYLKRPSNGRVIILRYHDSFSWHDILTALTLDMLNM